MEGRKAPHLVLGVHLTDRLTEAVEVQRTLTAFGGYIKTRIGLHEVSADGGPVGSTEGLVLLEVIGPAAKGRELAARLGAIAGVEVKEMLFEHP
jgi:hypothetical protein